jgi:hypothetical protein
MPTCNVLEFGAVGDGKTNDAAAIQKAIDACEAGGGGKLVFPAGKTFLCGVIVLKSNIELHLERGATLLASPKPADFHTYPKWKFGEAFITADGAENIAITGGGTIDGNGRAYVAEDLGYIYVMKGGRPFTFYLVSCSNVSMHDVTVKDGAHWTVRFSGCRDVVVDSIRIFNDLKLPNSDAIDFDHCQNVRVANCHIEAGDDCICLKARPEHAGLGPCENITVTGCTLVSTSAALCIGCEACEPIRNVVFDSCVIHSSHRGLTIHLSHACDVDNVIFSNMIVETRIFHDKWWGRGEPIYIVALPWTAQDKIGRIRNVRIMNVIARGENGVVVEGFAGDRIENLLLENVRIELNKTSKHAGGRQDFRPCPGVEMPERPTSGFMIHGASNVTLRHCEVAWGANRPEYYRHAVWAREVDQLKLEDVIGEAAHPGKFAAVSIEE